MAHAGTNLWGTSLGSNQGSRSAGRPGGYSLRQRPLVSGFMSIPICVSLLPDRANTCVGLYVLVTFAV